jgi:hypothetical protein
MISPWQNEVHLGGEMLGLKQRLHPIARPSCWGMGVSRPRQEESRD